MQTSHTLPEDGDHVQFVLEHRDLAMNGVYNRCMFASRWSEYEPGAVREWRLAPMQCGTREVLRNLQETRDSRLGGTSAGATSLRRPNPIAAAPYLHEPLDSRCKRSR